jgi:hypothetical protein
MRQPLKEGQLSHHALDGTPVNYSPVLANSPKRMWSVFGVAADHSDHPAGLMCDPRLELENTTLKYV